MSNILSVLGLSLLVSVSFTYPHELRAMNHESAYTENSHSDLLCSTSHEKDQKTVETFIAAQRAHIEELTLSIDALKRSDELAALGVCNERGVAYFFMGEFERALQDFNHVINELQTRQILEREIMGTALWGRLFCHAFQSQRQETYYDCQMIQLFSMECHCGDNQSETHTHIPAYNVKNVYSILPIANFAYPEEKVSEYECRDRVRNTADKMRSLLEFIPSIPIRDSLRALIWYEQSESIKCCNKGKHWTNCVGPIAEGWKTLENTWDQIVDLSDKGVNFAKFLFGK